MSLKIIKSNIKNIKEIMTGSSVKSSAWMRMLMRERLFSNMTGYFV
jgi:hypothetical protein